MSARDWGALLRGTTLLVAAGLAAMAAGLLPHGTLLLPMWMRLLIGVTGAVLTGLGLPAAWRWVRDGADGEAS